MLLGLTGGIGCGKSSALRCFAQLACDTLDADAICRGLYEDAGSELVVAVRRKWGAGVVGADGRIDRRKVGDIVFNDRAALLWLQDVIHPMVLAAAKPMLKSGRDTVFDVPLLFEVGWRELFDVTAAVWAPRETRLRRVATRGWDERELARREANQMSAEGKLESADLGVINNGDLTMLKKQCYIIKTTKGGS